jgi:hypothetical protein
VDAPPVRVTEGGARAQFLGARLRKRQNRDSAQYLCIYLTAVASQLMVICDLFATSGL